MPRAAPFESVDLRAPATITPRLAPLHALALKPGMTNLIQLRSFLETPRDHRGQALTDPLVRTFANKHLQDVLDVVGFFRLPNEQGKLETHLLVYDCVRPAVAARHLLGAPQVPNVPGGLVTNLPGRFMTSSLNDALTSVVTERLAARPTDVPFILGGASVVLPHAPEVAFTRAVQVEPPPSLPLVLPGDQFGPRVVRSLSLQSIVDGSLTGSLHDIRLVEAAFSLAEARGESLSLSVPLSSPHAPRYQGAALPVLSKAEIADVLVGDRDFGVSHLTLSETETPSAPYLMGYSVTGTAEDGSGTTVPFSAELVTRRNVDTVAVAGWCLLESPSGAPEPYLVLNYGARGALSHAVRETFPHPLAFSTNERHIELPHADIGDARSESEIAAHAITTFQAQTGLQIIPGSLTLALRGFRSPGFSPDCDHLYLAQVDPTALLGTFDHSSLNRPFLIRASDVRAMRHEGSSPDLLANVAAALVARMGHLSTHPSLVYGSWEERKLLQSLHDDYPNLVTLATEHTPELLSSVAVRRLLRQMTESLGQGIRLVTRSDEEEFFSPLTPDNPVSLSNLSSRDKALQTLLLAFHDASHFALGEYLPYQLTSAGALRFDANGRPHMQGKGLNREVLMTNEAYALFGDAEMARAIGIERYEDLTGEVSIARVFEEVGADRHFSRSQELSAIYCMVVKGEIPEEILKHPRYPTWRPVILSKLLGYYVRDQANCDLMHSFWETHPEVGEAALLLCPSASTDPGIFRKRFDALFSLSDGASNGDSIHLVREGFNPVRSALLRLRRSEIPRLGLDLALLKSYLRINGTLGDPAGAHAAGDINKCLNELSRAATILERVADKMANGNPSPEHLEHMRVLRTSVYPAIEEAEQLHGELLANASLFSASQRQERAAKQFYLIEQPMFSTETLSERIAERERWSIDRQA